MNLYIFFVLLLPFLSLVFSLFLNRNKTEYDMYFRLVLGYMFFNEVVGSIIGFFTKLSQIPVVNIYTIIFPLLNFLLYYKITNSDIVKKRIKLLSAGLLIFYLIDNLIYRNFFSDFQYHTYVVSTVILIYIIAIILLQIMESEIIQEYQRSKSFWISMGLLLFYVPFLPIMIAFKFMILNSEIRYMVNLLLIFVMNSCFIVASLWTKHR